MNDIRLRTQMHPCAEEKIRIVLEGLRGEENIETETSATRISLPFNSGNDAN